MIHCSTTAGRNSVSAANLDALTPGRAIYIWGASIVGFGACRALERHGRPPEAFIDSSPRFHGKTAMGYRVLSFDELQKNPEALRNAFIIIASGHYEDEIAARCMKAGLSPKEDFTSARALSPVDPSVDISGVCNLRCISCPRGNMAEQPPCGYMSAAVYSRVIDKLSRELPFMGNVQLYAWGEPLLNPEIAEIVRITVERKFLCAISTNLNARRDLGEVIRARPDWLKISASGFGASYGLTHTGGNWDLFLRNLHFLKELREKFHPEMYVEINYHLYRHNLGEDYAKMAALCGSLGFAFRPNWAYLYPLDNVLAYCEGREISPEARKTLDLLVLDIDRGLERARGQAHLPCAEERCFPIAWDLSVRSCGAYFKPTVADNFLDSPIEEILERRERSGICARCKRHALHRFTSVYLEEASPAEKPGPDPGAKSR